MKISAASQHRQPLVIGTTGHSQQQRQTIDESAHSAPIVFASNFSVGVNVLFWLTLRPAELLGAEFTPEIVETHHNLKKMRERHCEDTGRNHQAVRNSEIPTQSIREGDVVGEHTVTSRRTRRTFGADASCRQSRKFSGGALRAAQWVVDKPPGLYSMEDVLGL